MGAGGFASRAPQPGGEAPGTDPRAATTTRPPPGRRSSRQAAAVLPPDLQALQQTLQGADFGRIEPPTAPTGDPARHHARPVDAGDTRSAPSRRAAAGRPPRAGPGADRRPRLRTPAQPRRPGRVASARRAVALAARPATGPRCRGRCDRPSPASSPTSSTSRPRTARSAGLRPAARPRTAVTTGRRPASRSSVAAAPAVRRAVGDPVVAVAGGEATVPGATAQPGPTPATARGTGRRAAAPRPGRPGSALPTPAAARPARRRTADDAGAPRPTAPTAPTPSAPRRPGARPHRTSGLTATGDATTPRGRGDAPLEVRRSVDDGVAGSPPGSSAGRDASPAGDGPAAPGAGPDVRGHGRPDGTGTATVAAGEPRA